MCREPAAGWRRAGQRRFLAAASMLAASGLLLAGTVSGGEGAAQPASDPHAAHRALAASPSYRVNQAEYTVPDIVLQDQRGQPVRLRELFSGNRPLAVNFIFTSCTTVCPVMTVTMLQLQRELADQPGNPLFVSITVDPDYDNARELSAYAQRFGADWTFLTGPRGDVLEVLQAFSAWRGSKANHAVVTLFKSPNTGSWTRIEGLASASQLAELWREHVS
jgi:protein SCO1/2